jgi:hypothetical protein
MGTYSELLSSSASFARLLEDINQHQQEQEQKQEHEQQSISLTKQPSRIDSINSEKEKKEEIKSVPLNVETKQEGTVKWNVYISYLRAGVGVILGLFLIISIFSAQQAIALYSNWWLAEWSNDEGHRHRVYNNCISAVDQKMNRIRLMSNTEWNEHRNRQFYAFSGKYFHC